MIRRVLVAFFIAVCAFSPSPARAQSASQEMQLVLADLGAWMQEYQAIMNTSNEPFLAMDTYLSALDGFANGRTSASTARRGIREWRTRAVASIARARSAAGRLREPPNMSAYGPEGMALDIVLHTLRVDLEPGLTEAERVIHAVAELGLSALNNRAQGYEARERAVYQASIRLTTVDRRRVDVAAASISRNHPTQALMVASQHYSDTLTAVPEYALQVDDGADDDRSELVAALRQSAISMRAELVRARMLTEQLARQARDTQAGPGGEMARIMLRMLETFPPSITAYEGLADGIDELADALADGRSINDAWADQELNDRPFLAEISRLEELRAQVLATNAQSPL